MRISKVRIIQDMTMAATTVTQAPWSSSVTRLGTLYCGALVGVAVGSAEDIVESATCSLVERAGLVYLRSGARSGEEEEEEEEVEAGG